MVEGRAPWWRRVQPSKCIYRARDWLTDIWMDRSMEGNSSGTGDYCEAGQEVDERNEGVGWKCGMRRRRRKLKMSHSLNLHWRPWLCDPVSTDRKTQHVSHYTVREKAWQVSQMTYVDSGTQTSLNFIFLKILWPETELVQISASVYTKGQIPILISFPTLAFI